MPHVHFRRRTRPSVFLQASSIQCPQAVVLSQLLVSSCCRGTPVLPDLSSCSPGPLISPGLSPSPLRPKAEICGEKAWTSPCPTIRVTQTNKTALLAAESAVPVFRSMVPLQFSPGTVIGTFFSQVVFWNKGTVGI